MEVVKQNLKKKVNSTFENLGSESEGEFVLVWSKLSGLNGSTIQYSLFETDRGLVDEWVEFLN